MYYSNFKKKFGELTILQPKVYLYLFSKFQKEIRRINDTKAKSSSLYLRKLKAYFMDQESLINSK